MDPALTGLADSTDHRRGRLVRDHELRPPESRPGLGEHRRPRADACVAGSSGPAPGPHLPGPVGADRPGDAAPGQGPTSRPPCWSSATVQVLTVNRDATMYDEVPEETWTLAFGWYMHALFGLRYGLPFHRNLQPIFVSFHCNKRDLLTPRPSSISASTARSAAATGPRSTSCSPSTCRHSSPGA